MKIKLTYAGWWMVIIVMIVCAIIGVIYGRTSYIPEVCKNLKEEYSEPITKNHPEYSKYLDSNNDGIACQ